MSKDFEYAVCRALECLLNIHLSNQLKAFPDDKEMRDARDNYIASTIKLLENAAPPPYMGKDKKK